MAGPYFDFNGDLIAGEAGVKTITAATAPGQTIDAVGAFALVKDLAGGDTLIGGDGSTDFMVVDPNTVVVQGAHTGVSTVSAYANFSLPSGVNDGYAEQSNITLTGAADVETLLVADASKDVLIGGAGGDDVMVDNGAGSERFTFSAGGGHEVIYGFQASGAGQDFINLAAYGFTSFGQVQPLLSQAGPDTLLTLSSADSILIRGVQPSALTASDFLLALNTSAMTMTFDDAFSGLSLYDPATGQGTWKTSFALGSQTGAGSAASRTLTPNGEQEIYVDPGYAGTAGGSIPLGLDPFSIANGVLTITAAKTPAADLGALGGYQYTSGLLTTQTSFAQTYGYFEIKAELPTGQGVWPAFWLLPENAANADELDVMENVDGAATVFQTAHWGPLGAAVESSWNSAVAGLSSGFHTYGLLWTAQELVWYIDGKGVAEMATPASMNQPMYMLVDLAIGGAVAGAAPSTFNSAQMEVDYVRAYSLNGSTPATGASPAAYTVSSSTDVPADTGVTTFYSAYDYTMPTTFGTTLVLTGGGDLVATGNDLGDHIIGNTGNDTLIAGLGSNVLDGSQGGSDLLNGAQGVDTLIGGAGNTTFIVGDTSDVVTAVAGYHDVVQTSVDFHAPANVQTVAATGQTSVSLWANGAGDVLIANAGDDTLYGGAGNDSFAAGSGVDTFVAGTGTDTFWINNAADVIQNGPAGSNDVVQSTVSYHLPANMHELDLEGVANLSGWATNSGSVLRANAGDDVLYGGSGNDLFVAGSGLDTLIGGGGADTYYVNNYADVIQDASGRATVWSSVTFVLPNDVAVAGLTGSVNATLWAGSGNVTLFANAGNDTFFAGAGAGDDTLYGGAGQDHLHAGAGADSLISGTGIDTLIGGAGSDTFIINNPADIISTGTGATTVLSDVSFHLPDNILSGRLTGGSNLSLWAGAGPVSLYANAGNDTLYAGAGADTFYGGSGSDVMHAGAGNDLFDSGAGVDTMIGGAGADSYFVQNSADVIEPGTGATTIWAAVSYHLPDDVSGTLTGSANLSLWAGAGPVSLYANTGNDTIYAGAGADTFYGGSGSDVMYAGAGNDLFNSGAGVDTMIGGAGADSYFVQNSADVIEPGTGATTIWAAVSYHLPDDVSGTLTGSANLTLWAGAGAVNLYANSGADTLYAGAGADTFHGGAGSDVMHAGAGNDLFDSGTGVDTMIGGAGADSYFVQNSADVIEPGAGATTIWAAVSYHLPDDVSGTLTGSANLSLWAGAGPVSLYANTGNDRLYAGAGADTFHGGVGADTFVFGLHSAGDVVVGFAQGAHDVVDISAFLAAGYTASVANSGGNAVISVSSGETITLLGVPASAITQTALGYTH